MSMPLSGRHHAAIVVEVYSWCEEIDEAIAPLIEAFWQAGIPTMMSCQETGPGMTWIEFEELEHVQQFLNLIADTTTGLLRTRHPAGRRR